MNAGRELDALIAEKVMGWTRTEAAAVISTSPGSETTIIPAGWAEAMPDGSWEVKEIPLYSTDMTSAWEVVQKIKSMGYFWWMASHETGIITAHIRRKIDSHTFADGCMDHVGGTPHVWADTTAHSICLAALKAVGAEVAV